MHHKSFSIPTINRYDKRSKIQSEEMMTRKELKVTRYDRYGKRTIFMTLVNNKALR